MPSITNLVVLELGLQLRPLCFFFLCYTTMSFYLIWMLEEVFWDTLNQYIKETYSKSRPTTTSNNEYFIEIYYMLVNVNQLFTEQL